MKLIEGWFEDRHRERVHSLRTLAVLLFLGRQGEGTAVGWHAVQRFVTCVPHMALNELRLLEETDMVALTGERDEMGIAIRIESIKLTERGWRIVREFAAMMTPEIYQCGQPEPRGEQ